MVRILLPFGAVVRDFINHITFATNDIMRLHPEEVRAFNEAWFETVKWMRQNKDETVKIAMPVMGKPPEIVAKAYDIVMPSLSDTGKFDPKGLTPWRDPSSIWGCSRPSPTWRSSIPRNSCPARRPSTGRSRIGFVWKNNRPLRPTGSTPMG